MTFAATIFTAAAAPQNEFGYVGGDPTPWYETILPILGIIGIWLAICGLVTWIAATRITKRWGASWLAFLLSSPIPLMMFLTLFIGATITSGARSLGAIATAFGRIQPEGWAIIFVTALTGVVIAGINLFRRRRIAARVLQQRLCDLT